MPVKVTTIHSPLDADTAYWRLDAITRPKPGFWRSLFREEAATEGIAFEGTMEYPSFKVTRIITYRNSFLPVIRGSLRPAAKGSDIRLLMTLHPAVAVLMAVWLFSTGAPVGSALLEWPRASIPVVPAGMFGFGLALTVVGFFAESSKAESVIRECVGGVKPPPQGEERLPT